VEKLLLQGTGNLNATGNALDNVLAGNSGNNILTGGAGNDFMMGLAGNDTYYVDAAGDVVSEGAGEGTDTVQTTLLSYTLGANVENLIFTGAGNFAGTGNILNNAITGGAGNDSLNGLAGNDTMSGGTGNDTYVVDAAGDVVTELASQGTDLVQTTLAVYTLGNDVENLTYTGAGNFTGIGNAGNNVITGGVGNDLLNGDQGNDTMVGGAGNDTYYISDSNDAVSETVGGGLRDVERSLISRTISANVEVLELIGIADIDATGGAGNDFLVGNSGNNVLNGIGGNNVLSGGAGNDTMFGDGGNDTMSGGAGNDVYYVDLAGDQVIEAVGEGKDIVLSTRSRTIDANVEALMLLGGADLNATGLGGADELYGNGGNNVLSGAAGNDSLAGNAGNDTLDGGLGNDLLMGGVGNDVYYVDNTDYDTVTENAGEGNDTVYSSVTYWLPNNVEALILTGTGDISAVGNVGNDYLAGNSGNNFLTGSTGNDTLVGGAGNDGYSVDSIYDTVTEQASGGNDTVYASVSWDLQQAANVEVLQLTGSADITAGGTDGNDILYGNSGNNMLYGRGGNDTLIAAAGDDTLFGDAGNDSMLGGSGNDVYYVDSLGDVVEEGLNSGTDIVLSSVSRTIDANVESLVLSGSADINATGLAGNDSLYGNSGNNSLDGGSGADYMSGGDEDDRYYVDNAGDIVVEHSGEGTDVVYATVSRTIDANVELLFLQGTADLSGLGDAADNRLYGNTGNNTLSGAGGNDVLWGMVGNDTMSGGAGNDQLDGGGGNDSMSGGAGNDSYWVDSANDVISELAAEGNDSVFATVSYTLGGNVEALFLLGTSDLNGVGSSGNDSIVGNAGNNSLNGMAGNDTLEGGAGNDTYGTDSAGDVIVEAAGNGYDIVWTSVSRTLDENVEEMHLSGSSDFTLWGRNSNDFLWGNSGNNTLLGSGGNDTLVGLTGSDTYYVTEDDDVVIEEAGGGTLDVELSWVSRTISANVEILSLQGSDNIYGLGGTGNDNINGNSGNNTLYGYDGNDTIHANEGNDSLWGGNGSDKLYGGSGNDTFTTSFSAADPGNDSLWGEDGNDWMDSGNGYDYLSGGNGDDTLYGYAGNDTLEGGEGNDLLHGWGDNDTLFGDAGNDQVYGSDGDDWLQGDVGNDSLYGGAGNDTAFGGEDTDIVQGENGNDRLYGGNGADTLYGGNDNDSLYGEAGNDALYGEGGDDRLEGGDGNDWFVGSWNNRGVGNDSLVGGAGCDTYNYMFASNSNGVWTTEGFGNDVIVAANDNVGDMLNVDNIDGYSVSGNDLVLKVWDKASSSYVGTVTLQNWLLADTGQRIHNVTIRDGFRFFGNGSTPRQYYFDFDASGVNSADLSARSTSQMYFGGNGADVIAGGTASDWLRGDIGADTISGNGGDDDLFGGNDNDWISGGDGNDFLRGGIGNDSLIGGVGNDVYRFGSGDPSSPELFGNDTISAGSGNENMNDMIFMKNVDGAPVAIKNGNHLVIQVSGIGSITLENWYSGGVGNQVHQVRVDYGTMTQIGRFDAGTDSGETMNQSGNAATVMLFGLGGNDSLVGSAFDDFLSGGDGNDTLVGGAGNENLYGGAGCDAYVFAGAFGNDSIFADGVNANANDAVLFSSINHSQGVASVTGGNSLLLSYGGNTVTIDRWLFGGDYKLNYFSFADGNYALTDAYEWTSVGGNTPLGTYVSGGAGNDTIVAAGAAGNDTLDGGLGNDVYNYGFATPGNGTWYLAPFGNDFIVAGNTNSSDRLILDNVDSFYVGGGDVTLKVWDIATASYAGTVTLQGWASQPDSERLHNITTRDGYRYWGVGNDPHNYYLDIDVSGTNSKDYTGNTANQMYFGLSGNDTITGGNGSDMLTGDSGNDWIYGGAGDDDLFGGDGDDYLSGGAGNDNFRSHGGNDILIGGTGADVYRFGSGSVLNGEIFGNDAIDGDANDIAMLRNMDEPSFVAQYGNNLVFNFYMNDGNSTNDSTITVLNWFTNSEANKVRTIKFNNSFTNNYYTAGLDVLTSGADTKNYSGNGVSVYTSNMLVYGMAGNDTITGGNGWDYLLGGEGQDSLIGGSGNDTLAGGNGDDRLFGGAGNDVYLFGDDVSGDWYGNDVILSASDNAYDAVVFQVVSPPMDAVQSGNDLLIQFFNGDHMAIQTLTLQDYYRGAGYALGGLGFDYTPPSGSNESMMIYTSLQAGTAGNDLLNYSGSSTNMFIFGMAGNDSIIGGSGNNVLYGNAGNDTLQGGTGMDLIVGGEGNDSMSGGTGGMDQFIFFGNWGNDRVVANVPSGHLDSVWLPELTHIQLAFSFSGNDLIFTYGSNSITMENWLVLPDDQRLNGFQFADQWWRIQQDGSNFSWQSYSP
jgi:Ca2+-binding RTX toxin-like protein